MQKVGRTIRRRRREGRTDYKARFSFLKSQKPRIVFRKSNRFVTGQLVVTEIAQDNVKISVSSKDLMSFGWPKELQGSLKSLPACYLTGYLLGKKITEKEEMIFDIGLQRNIHGGRIYAFLRGIRDAGASINCSEDVLPSDEVLTKNEKTGKLISQLKEKLK